MRSRSLWLAVVVLGLFARPAVADVVIVGNCCFADIQPAVDAANDGDIVLVKAGLYTPFTIVDKSLTVVSDGLVVIQGGSSITVSDLAPARAVVLSGLTVRILSSDAALLLRDNLGSVRVERCELTYLGSFLSGSGTGATVEGCEDVAFTDCAFQAGVGFLSPEPWVRQPGARVSTSTVAFYNSELTGLQGPSGFLELGGPCLAGGVGGAGLLVEDAVVYASASVFEGAPGGLGSNADPFPPFCQSAGGPGGPGLELAGPGAVVRLLGCTLVPGAGGSGGIDPINGGPPAPDGPPGVDMLTNGGLVIDVPREPHGLSMPVPVREFETLPVDIEGVAGDAAGLFVSIGPDSFFEAPLQSQVLVSFAVPIEFLLVGFVPGSGVLSLSGSFADLPGLEGATIYLQPIFQSTTGVLTMGAPVTEVVLDSSFPPPP